VQSTLRTEFLYCDDGCYCRFVDIITGPRDEGVCDVWLRCCSCADTKVLRYLLNPPQAMNSIAIGARDLACHHTIIGRKTLLCLNFDSDWEFLIRSRSKSSRKFEIAVVFSQIAPSARPFSIPSLPHFTPFWAARSTSVYKGGAHIRTGLARSGLALASLRSQAYHRDRLVRPIHFHSIPPLSDSILGWTLDFQIPTVGHPIKMRVVPVRAAPPKRGRSGSVSSWSPQSVCLAGGPTVYYFPGKA
jgi:hypothetical protein